MERHHVFAQLQANAINALEQASQEPPASGLSVSIQLLAYPSFGSYRSWTIFADRNRERIMARQITWDMLGDLERFTNPLEGLKQGWQDEPAIAQIEQNVSAKELTPRLDALSRIKLPLNHKPTIGIDGTTYGLQMPGYGSSIHLTWWVKGPDAWHELTTWAADTRAFLSRIFAGDSESK